MKTSNDLSVHINSECLVRLLLIVILLGLMAELARAQVVSDGPAIPDQIIDQASFALKGKNISSHAALAVDKDDEVKLYNWFENADHKFSDLRISQYLGQRINLSGSLALSDVIPKHEVAVRSYRVTGSNQQIFHVVITWGLNRETQESLEPWYNLYVLRQTPDSRRATKVHVENNIELRLAFVQVRNLGGEGLTEIIDIGGEDRGDVATVRELAQDGRVQRLQQIEGDEITFLGERFSDANILRVEDQWSAARPWKPGSPCSSVRVFKWSREKKRFVEAAEK